VAAALHGRSGPPVDFLARAGLDIRRGTDSPRGRHGGFRPPDAGIDVSRNHRSGARRIGAGDFGTPGQGGHTRGWRENHGQDGRGKTENAEGEVGWIALELTFSGGAATLYAGPNAAFIDALTAAGEGAAESAAKEPADEAQEAAGDAAGASKTFDLLLDVEMPVSVSFGRAKVPLKDVLKLTTGSIVELNRSLIEPVEVIVNNCVIARGEVVVVEGNFGVRIQQVVSRRERLRTLN